MLVALVTLVVHSLGNSCCCVGEKPDPQADHAVRMTKFARECMRKVTDLTHKLETSLGPDTGDLSMRFGLHSGPVTAGVLRGEKSRFQLFGDTVNTGKREKYAKDIEAVGPRSHHCIVALIQRLVWKVLERRATSKLARVPRICWWRLERKPG